MLLAQFIVESENKNSICTRDCVLYLLWKFEECFVLEFFSVLNFSKHT